MEYTGPETSKCSRCGNERFIVNARYNVCDDCNYFRLHGETKFDVAFRKQAERRSKQKEKTTHKIPFQSVKGRKLDKELSEIKQAVRQKAFDEDRYYCKGCGKAVGLDCSHRVAISQSSEMKTDEGNLSLLCRVCHENWESSEIKRMIKLRCFLDDMRYLYHNHQIKFQKILFKLLDYVRENDHDVVARALLLKIEKLEDAKSNDYY